MRERDVDRMFVARCKERGIRTYKIGSAMNRGVPDRLLVGPSRARVGFVEVKAWDGKLTHHQLAFFEALIGGPHDGTGDVFAVVLRGGRNRQQTGLVIESVLDEYLRQ